jgi:hypothetical protein
MAEMQKSQGHHIVVTIHNTCFSLHLHAFYEQVKKTYFTKSWFIWRFLSFVKTTSNERMIMNNEIENGTASVV